MIDKAYNLLFINLQNEIKMIRQILKFDKTHQFNISDI